MKLTKEGKRISQGNGGITYLGIKLNDWKYSMRGWKRAGARLVGERTYWRLQEIRKSYHKQALVVRKGCG